MIKKTIPFLLLALLIQSCTEPDTTEPVIQVLSTVPAPTSGLVCGQMEDLVVFIGSDDTLEIELKISDDTELSQYKLDLHNNFDCHGHGKLEETTDWYVLNIVDLLGAEQIVNIEIPVPSDVTSGNYHFSVQATDASGNNAESLIYAVQVTNATDADAPVLDISVPTTSGISVLKGDVINFQGVLIDNQPLGPGANGRIELRYWNTSNQTINELYSEDFENSVGPTVNIDFDATVPSTAVDGTYIFELRGFDAVNNQSNEVQFTVEVD